LVSFNAWQIGWKYKLELSNAFQHHHHHLTCLQCGGVTPLPEDGVARETAGPASPLSRL